MSGRVAELSCDHGAMAASRMTEDRAWGHQNPRANRKRSKKIKSILKSKHILAAAAVGALALAASPRALALTSEIYIVDVTSGQTETISNTNGSVTLSGAGGSGTESDPSGLVAYSGSLSGWSILVTCGSAEQANNGIQDLNVMLTGNSSAGQLKIFFASDSLTSAAGGFLAQSSFTDMSSSYSAAYTAFQDTGVAAAQAVSDAVAGSSSSLTKLTSFSISPGDSLPNYSASQAASTNYSLVQELNISYANAPTGSANGDLYVASAPDGGVTASLLGFTFLGLAAIRRKLQAA